MITSKLICEGCLQPHDRYIKNVLKTGQCTICGKTGMNRDVVGYYKRQQQLLSDFKQGLVDILVVPISCDNDYHTPMFDKYDKLYGHHFPKFPKFKSTLSSEKRLLMGSMDVLPLLIKGKVRYIVHAYLKQKTTDEISGTCLSIISRHINSRLTIGFKKKSLAVLPFGEKPKLEQALLESMRHELNKVSFLFYK